MGMCFGYCLKKKKRSPKDQFLYFSCPWGSDMVSSLRKKQFKLSESSSVLWYLGGCCTKTMLLCFQDILKSFLGTCGPCSRCLVFTLPLDYVPAFLHLNDGNDCSSPMLQWSELPLMCCAPRICLSVGSCPFLQQSDSSLVSAIALGQSCCRDQLPIQSWFPSLTSVVCRLQ